MFTEGAKDNIYDWYSRTKYQGAVDHIVVLHRTNKKLNYTPVKLELLDEFRSELTVPYLKHKDMNCLIGIDFCIKNHEMFKNIDTNKIKSVDSFKEKCIDWNRRGLDFEV